MTDDFDTESQTVIRWVLTVALGAALLSAGIANAYAVIDCAPQAGKWTPWTGQICYGEKP